MPRTNARVDIRVEKAVGFLQRCPNLTVPEAMKLAETLSTAANIGGQRKANTRCR